MTHEEEQQLNEALDKLTEAYLQNAHLRIRCDAYERTNAELYKRIAELEKK